MVPLDKPPAVLTDRAEQILTTLGYTEPRGDTAHGLGPYAPYLPWIARQDSGPRRWDVLAADRPGAFLYWYRTSPRDLAPRQLALHVTPLDPPQTDTDMHTVTVDMRGRLVGLTSVPRQFDDTPPLDSAPPWPRLFELADLPITDFTPVATQWAPRDFADARAAWEGPLPGRADIRVRVEAASYRGRPVSFLLIGPWTVATRMQTGERSLGDRMGFAILLALSTALLVGALLLARHNVRLGRADRRGATRVAVFVVCTEITSWIAGNHHVTDLRLEALSFTAIASDAVALGVCLWIIYAGLEPYARRFWPQMLLGWSRLVSGRIRDPRVGGDVLLGAAFGVGWFALDVARRLLPQALGFAATMPRLGNETTTLFGAAETLSTWAAVILRELQVAFAAALLFVILRLLVRRTAVALAVGITIVFYWWSTFSMTPVLPIEVAYEGVVVCAFTFVLIRFGLLVAAVARIVLGVCEAIPFTLHVAHWSATPSNWTVAAILALAVFGFYAARAGQPLFGKFTPP
jgi:hypothetical protein